MADLPPLTRQPDPKPVAEMSEDELREHIANLEEYHETDRQYREQEIYSKMVLACPEQNMLEHSGKHVDPWERLTSFVNASRQERHDLKAKLKILENAVIRIKTRLPDRSAGTGLTDEIRKLIEEALDEMRAI